MEENKNFWVQRVERYGHTGWADAAIYAFDQPIRLNLVRMLVEKYLMKAKDSSALLDFGCGTGEFSNQIKDLFGKSVLYDPCKEVLDMARIHAIKNATFLSEKKSLCELNLQYNVILSITVLQHIMDDMELKETLAMLVDSLAEDGVFIIMESFMENLNSDYERAWNFEQFDHYMTEAGLVLQEAYDFYHPTEDDIPGFKSYYQRDDVKELKKMCSKDRPEVFEKMKEIARKYNSDTEEFISSFSKKDGSKFMVYKKK